MWQNIMVLHKANDYPDRLAINLQTWMNVGIFKFASLAGSIPRNNE